MKYLILFLLLTGGLSSAEEKPVSCQSQILPLSGLLNFDVIILISPYENFNCNQIYSSMTASLKKIASVKTTEKPSLLPSIIQDGIACPLCYFTISKNEDILSVTLEVLAQAEFLPNKYQTVLPIWKDSISLSLSPETTTATGIDRLITEITENFAVNWKQANKEKRTPSFHLMKFTTL